MMMLFKVSIYQVIQQVNLELSQHFHGAPKDVFGNVVDELNKNAESTDWHALVQALEN